MPDKNCVTDSSSSQMIRQVTEQVTAESHNRMQLVQLQRKVEELAAQLQVL